MGAPQILHATAVAIDGQGVLIRGASGSGKSSLALELMARGAILVSDDRTVLSPHPDGVELSAPPAIAGKIEARGIGLLRARCTTAMLSVVLDLDVTETKRLPLMRYTVLQGREVPLLHKVDTPYFASALMQYIAGGRED